MTDLSLVVTAHDETSVSGPTMRSADLAVEAARSAGITVQTIICLDRATDSTMSYFRQARFDHWERWEFDEGDLGRVRNAIMPHTDGRLTAFLDADDLFSENWLVEAVRALDDAAARGERALAHPELSMVFDGVRLMWVNLPDDSPPVHPLLPLRAALLRLALHGSARGAPRDPLRQPRRGQRALLPGLPVHDRDPRRWLAASRRAGHDHLQEAQRLLAFRHPRAPVAGPSYGRCRAWRWNGCAAWAGPSAVGDAPLWCARPRPPDRRTPCQRTSSSPEVPGSSAGTWPTTWPRTGATRSRCSTTSPWVTAST